ncbi:endo alpha-1,4 polygalactosaminidase [Actinoplanes sp. NPDC051851]|uniref:endo alpha-1,4 polygalactosaminidase n=1 Tax=Actinoplanes sp. NPDC051851 TaxID=3154753 RepID=UPI00341A561E
MIIRRVTALVLAVSMLPACTAESPRMPPITMPPSTATGTEPDYTFAPPDRGSVRVSTTPSPPVLYQKPPVNATFDYQIGGAYQPGGSVRVVDRDRAETAVTGRYGICYVNAFQTQPGEADLRRWILEDDGGQQVEDPDWPGEYLLDISTAANRTALAAAVGEWFAGCARNGYQAVEPDNLDSWTRSAGALTEDDAVAYAKMLVENAHRHGLAIGQKNTAEFPAVGFDFAVVEECQPYDECDWFRTAFRDRMFEIEYTRAAYETACADHGTQVSVILRDRDVVAQGAEGYVYEQC